MSKNRKDDHINIAKSFKKKPNMFDKIILDRNKKQSDMKADLIKRKELENQ